MLAKAGAEAIVKTAEQMHKKPEPDATIFATRCATVSVTLPCPTNSLVSYSVHLLRLYFSSLHLSPLLFTLLPFSLLPFSSLLFSSLNLSSFPSTSLLFPSLHLSSFPFSQFQEEEVLLLLEKVQALLLPALALGGQGRGGEEKDGQPCCDSK